MQVEVLSETRQRFMGKTYYLCGKYFQRNGVRLHREVWREAHGDIPEGYEVHHIDANRANNQLENLVLMEGGEHNSMHAKAANHDKAIMAAQEAARAWHSTSDGQKFHSELARKNWSRSHAKTYTCSWCLKPYSTRHMYGAGQNHFCCANCRAAATRKRKRDAREGKVD